MVLPPTRGRSAALAGAASWGGTGLDGCGPMVCSPARLRRAGLGQPAGPFAFIDPLSGPAAELGCNRVRTWHWLESRRSMAEQQARACPGVGFQNKARAHWRWPFRSTGCASLRWPGHCASVRSIRWIVETSARPNPSVISSGHSGDEKKGAGCLGGLRGHFRVVARCVSDRVHGCGTRACLPQRDGFQGLHWTCAGAFR